MAKQILNQDHSTAWIVQTWATFVISLTGMTLGILNLPVDNWIKGFMGMGLTFTVGSTLSLAKTSRDMHESKRITSRIDEARVEKILSEHGTL
ncbi:MULTISPECIES: YiaA/YiaB family inner membrane protein [Spirulina sp. CCY15215]|uniref:YiaA/YiaB family inner membrane protein n=1 Tax=Spirulina sp. CCY15215 TaxID=2767591 RepID=UPI00194EB07D|nr:YiaA/YiaB family inner membrane protein [Spirulina major]